MEQESSFPPNGSCCHLIVIDISTFLVIDEQLINTKGILQIFIGSMGAFEWHATL